MEISNSFILFLSIMAGIGYFFTAIHDLAQIKKIPLLSFVSFAGYPMTLLPLILIPFRVSVREELPFLLVYILWSLAALFFLLLVYSVSIEIYMYNHKLKNQNNPAIKKDTEKDAYNNMNTHDRKCFKKGTYSFSRHPGFIWFTLLNLLFVILFFTAHILYLMILCTIFNLSVIIWEDRYAFPRLFNDYYEYKKNVPFIL
ncbi:MAG: hypothetical protein K9L24_04545 [Spirochaetia bacterium]|nr:hypothetical protein [Spirochaetia bacterium]MCF7946488.1 hypothetical protein [Spirochaetia bacterium]